LQTAAAVESHWCYTQNELATVQYRWTIDTFSMQLPAKEVSLCSAVFTGGAHRWRIKVVLNGLVNAYCHK
jgi:hypothetical protein